MLWLYMIKAKVWCLTSVQKIQEFIRKIKWRNVKDLNYRWRIRVLHPNNLKLIVVNKGLCINS